MAAVTEAPTVEVRAEQAAAASARKVNAAVGVFVAAALVGWLAALILVGVHAWALPLPAGVEPQGAIAVITSQWAYLGPVPLALVGAAYYATMVVAAGVWATTRDVRVERLLLPATAVGVAASAGLVWLQLGPIGAICPFCMASAAASTTLLAMELLVRRWGGAAAAPAWRGDRVWPVLAALLAVSAVVTVHVVAALPIPQG